MLGRLSARAIAQVARRRTRGFLIMMLMVVQTFGGLDKIMPDVSVDVGEAEVAPTPAVGEFFVVDTELMEDGRPEIVDG